ncbi:MAG: TRAP transporter small permease [Neomegalonema sp.]|nr:TRAP transporter small permease [Neomegalonema sp.]
MSNAATAGPPPDKGRQAKPLISRFLDLLARICAAVAGVCLVTIIVIFSWLVFGRYVLNDTPTWVEQASVLLVAYATFLGAALGVREGFHLSIDFIREATPHFIRLPMRVLADLAMIVFGALMAWYGVDLFAANTNRMIPLIGLSESWRVAPLAGCGALIVLFGAGDLVERLFLGVAHDAPSGADQALSPNSDPAKERR